MYTLRVRMYMHILIACVVYTSMAAGCMEQQFSSPKLPASTSAPASPATGCIKKTAKVPRRDLTWAEAQQIVELDFDTLRSYYITFSANWMDISLPETSIPPMSTLPPPAFPPGPIYAVLVAKYDNNYTK